MNKSFKNRKELKNLFDEAGNIMTNHLLNSTDRKAWFNRTPSNLYRKDSL